MKSKEDIKDEILYRHVGRLAVSGIKWKSLDVRKKLLHDAMEEYAQQFKDGQRTPADDTDNDCPTFEQIGGGKNWDEMTDLEKCNYDLMKAKNALVVSRNTSKRLRGKSSTPADDAVKFAEWIREKKYCWNYTDLNYYPAWDINIKYTIQELYKLFKGE